jgi:hypothetical protein
MSVFGGKPGRFGGGEVMMVRVVREFMEPSGAWDQIEPIVEACKITGMVVLAPFPVMPGIEVAPRSVVLGKLFDTLAEVPNDE